MGRLSKRTSETSDLTKTSQSDYFYVAVIHSTAELQFYWYYQWMTKRIEHKCGFLPDPVMDKLLCMDANELDTLLSSTNAIRAQVPTVLFSGVYE